MLTLFKQVTGSDEVNRPKPAPDIVLHTLDVLGIEAGEAMMIGDAVIDLVSAQSAGVTAVAALWGQADEPALLAAQPDAVLREPADVLGLCASATGSGSGQ